MLQGLNASLRCLMFLQIQNEVVGVISGLKEIFLSGLHPNQPAQAAAPPSNISQTGRRRQSR